MLDNFRLYFWKITDFGKIFIETYNEPIVKMLAMCSLVLTCFVCIFSKYFGINTEKPLSELFRFNASSFAKNRFGYEIFHAVT